MGSWREMRRLACHKVDLSSAAAVETTSQKNFAAPVKMGQFPRQHWHQHLPLRQVPHRQDCANHGASTTRRAGKRNAHGINVPDVLHASQDGSVEVTSCFSDGTNPCAIIT